MKIKVYSTPVCQFCNLVKQFLNEHQLEYEEINVAADENKAQEMVAKSGQMGVPVSIIEKDDGGEEIIVGFNQNKLKEVLNIK